MGPAKSGRFRGFSAGRERECRGRFLSRLVVGGSMAVRTAQAAGLGAGAESFVDDGLDGAGAAAAFGAAAEAAVDLLRMARQITGGADGIANIMVAKDVAGTDDHEVGESIGDASGLSDIEAPHRMQKEKPQFQAIPN
jgi:hypothetical protein